MDDLPLSLPGARPPDVAFDFDGERIPAVAGEPIGVALLRAGRFVLSRSAKYHRPRGLFCLAGTCGNCLLRVAGAPDARGCATPVRDGLVVETQHAVPNAGHDLLRAIDWAFPRGLDPHGLFARVPLARAAMAGAARHLSGLGALPDRALPLVPPLPAREADLCLVGLGHAGRAAATAARAGGATLLAVDRDEPVANVEGVEVWTGAEALGIWRDGERPLLLLRRDGALQIVRPRRLLLCTGSRDQNLLFAGNDLPGILGGRAVERLVTRHRLLPSRSALVLGGGPQAEATCRVLVEAGAEVAWAAEGSGPEPAGVRRLADHRAIAARGDTRVREVVLEGPAGRFVWRGGLVASCAPRAAAFELGVQAGLAVTASGPRGFPLRAAPDGATRLPWLWAAGSCTDAPVPAGEHGALAGRAAAR